MLCNCLLMSKDGFVRPCLATITGGMNLGIFFVPAHDYGRWWYDWTYQLPPYSKVVHTLDGHENMKGFTYYWYIYIFIYLFVYIYTYYFFFGGCGAWGSAQYWLLNGGVAHIMATCLISIGWGVLFPLKTFSGFPHFSRQNLLIFGFPLLFFIFYFFTFSLRLASLTSWVAHFALSLLSFLPNFQVRPLFTLFSFLNFACAFVFWVPFFFMCFSLPFLSGVVSFNGGLLWS